jgi:integrase
MRRCILLYRRVERMLVRELLDEEYAVLRSLKPTAHYQFVLTLRRWEQFLGRPPALADFDPLAVQRFLNHRKTQVSAATAKKDRTHIVAIWSHAAKRRLVDQFPTLPAIRAPQRIPRAYRVQDVSALLTATQGLQGAAGGLPAALWWSCILRLAWETAERVGAILQLRWDDVDLDALAVVFRGETRKSGTRDIRRRISAELAAELRQIQRRPVDLVFPWHTQYTSIWWRLRRLCEAAGVVPRGFHGLRKAAASYVAAAGGNATELLDHSNPKLAKDHYLDEGIVQPRQSAIDLLPPLTIGATVEPTGEDKQMAVDAGMAAGRRTRAAGGPNPGRHRVDALAAEAGLHPSLLVQWRWGFAQGYADDSGAA